MNQRRRLVPAAFALGCCTQSLGDPVQDFQITISGITVPASQVFTDEFLNARSIPSVQQLAATLLSGSAGSPPVVNDDGSVTVRGLIVVEAGGAKAGALAGVLRAPASFPAQIPVSLTPATVLTAPTAAWWTAVARANTTDAALNRLQVDIANNQAAVTQTGAVVGGGYNPSTGNAPVYVTLQPDGAVNVAVFQASGGRVFAQTAPATLAPLSPGVAPAGASSATAGTDFFSHLFTTTAQQVATIKANQVITGLTAPPPLPLPATPPGSTFPSNQLGLGFGGLPPPPLAPPVPVAMPQVPTSGNIVSPPFILPTLSISPPAAPQPVFLPQPGYAPALPVFGGIPSTAATGDGSQPLTASGFISSLANAAPVAPALPVATTPWLKYGAIAAGVLALGFFAFRAGGSRPAYRRRRA